MLKYYNINLKFPSKINETVLMKITQRVIYKDLVSLALVPRVGD